MLGVLKAGGAALLAGFLATNAMAVQPVILTFDAQTNPPAANPTELHYTGGAFGSLQSGPGSIGNGDGAALGVGLAPGLNVTTPVTLAPGILGEQNNTDGSTSFFDVTLLLGGLQPSGPTTGNAFFVSQPLGTGTFGFYSSALGGGPGTPLLLGTFSNAFISGGVGSSSAGVISATITYTGGVIYSQVLAQRGGNLGSESISLSQVSPGLARDVGGFLTPFDANANGQFSISSIPEPGSLSLLGLGAIGLLRRRRA